MVDLEKWIKLYRSPNPAIRVRAAQALIHGGSEPPLSILLNILDELSDAGLGAGAEKALMSRNDPALFDEMIKRLDAEDWFIREVSCNILGKLGNRQATPYLLKQVNDSHLMVRRAAGFALALLKDRMPYPRSSSNMKSALTKI